MTSAISKFVTKTLCDHQGCLDFKRLNEKIAQNFTAAESVLRRVVFDEERVAIQRGTEQAAGRHIINPDSLLVAKTSLRLCQHKHGDCLRCDALHLCRYYVCGDCSFGPRCKNPHSLAYPYNAELLQRYNLQDLTEKQLFQLLLQNDPFLLPEICPHYNKGNGQHGSCKFTTTCTKLHVCLHFLKGNCKFGSSCKRTHNIDAQATKLLRGVSQENMNNLLKIYRSKLIIMVQQEGQATSAPVSPTTQQLTHSSPRSPITSVCPSKPISDVERNEICLFFIRKDCSFKEKCARIHWHLPYRWQVLNVDGVSWKDLPNMDAIEEAYCDPKNDTSCINPSSTSSYFKVLSLESSESSSVDFMTMTYGGFPVRRVSTASSVSKPPHFILTTQWLWYWEDEGRKWVQYGQSDGDIKVSITSETLENVYLAERDTEIPFSAGKQQYILHFKGAKVYQQNVKYKTTREVRRRPRFVSAHDVEVKLKGGSPHSSSSSTAESFPSHWDKNALPDYGYKLVLISNTENEYNMIERLFKCTMPLSKINNLQRIQNPSLWKVFQWQKEQMKGRNGGKAVNEQHLFHGTDESLIDAICQQNFDWRMCGAHGTAYGKGSYFARDASFSNTYAKVKRNLKKIMFVALVLVGEYTKGSSSYLRPPAKGKSTDLYDSCVNSESNPSIYVIFDKQQIYPEYIIEYS